MYFLVLFALMEHLASTKPGSKCGAWNRAFKLLLNRFQRALCVCVCVCVVVVVCLLDLAMLPTMLEVERHHLLFLYFCVALARVCSSIGGSRLSGSGKLMLERFTCKKK